MFSSATDEWATPIDFFEQLDNEFHFNLDPCANEENHKCELYFTKEQNGLQKSWGGTECSVILRMAERLASGLRNATRNLRKITRWLFCLYQQEQIQNIFTTIFTIKLKYGLFVEGLDLEMEKQMLRFRLWWQFMVVVAKREK